MRLKVEAFAEERTAGQQQWDLWSGATSARLTVLVPGASSCCEGCSSTSCVW